MKWYFDRISKHTTKLWRFEAIGGFHPLRLRKNVYKMLFEGGIGALPKVLEVYMGEAVFPTNPTRGKTTQPS